MCLAVPGQVIEWLDRTLHFEQATIGFGQIRRSVNMACVPDAQVGEYVLVHAGIALNVIDAREAELTLKTLESLDLEPD